ncbi:hypothetical protein K402DRAFT_367166 [Aulographum hederae CBS 113979]|uniref:ABM domain-containing protein n=1 Tax=Aulographum hederae CBS 113979 TaxID=1176131 RepID=A0A6G1HFL7_9PEZI|nr:hypothetical protein K402DRAFT_367166 [Aulographum hederae CBS 113979]
MFYLFANCNFVPGRYEDWQSAYDELGEYVWHNEKTTETYYFGIPMDYAHDISNTTLMLAFEVYGKREDLYQTHFSSPAMSTFLSKIPPTMTTGLDLVHYSLSSGYLDGPGDSRPCGIMSDHVITCNSHGDRNTVLSQLKALTKTVEESESKSSVYTFMAFSSLDNDVGVRIYGRYKDRATYETFQRRQEMVDFWLESKDQVKAMAQRLYVPNGKGWLHR